MDLFGRSLTSFHGAIVLPSVFCLYTIMNCYNVIGCQPAQ